MLINVPQYIDVEDKIVGPLTIKQLGWLIVLGVVLLILWNILPKAGFFVIGLPITLLLLAFAFYKPYGQPLGSFVIYAFMYYFKPKVYIWRRTSENVQAMSIPKTKQQKKVVAEKKLSKDQVRDLAQLLDSEGQIRNEKILEMLKETKK